MNDASADTITQDSGDELRGFADQLASCLVKETIKETGGKSGEQEQEWSIPCSSICHKHSNDSGSGKVVCEAGTSGVRSSSGHLCWTPESGEGGQELLSQCSDTMGQEDTIRKGVSVPNINVSQASANSDPEHDNDTTDRLSCSSENSKSHKSRGFLNSLGIKTKHKSDISNVHSTRPKMKGLKKTLSSLFSAKPRDSSVSQDSSATKKPSSSKFKLPSVSKRSKAVDPCQRALPPVPPSRDIPNIDDHEDDENRLGVTEFDHDQLTPHHSPSQISPRSGADNESDIMDFAASIERVKDRGWYWGPLSGEAAERLLASEPDASFVVRDSSDHHYIFSLTFKLNGVVRHVRIEHDQGNFSFGSLTRFKNTTIVDFIENAVEHSKSGRYLFFLHRRPVLGPMRVQLLYPVSRFKSVQSLQHLCRYVIVKVVRKDHLDQLPVPNRIKKYLNTSFYYSEQVSGNDETSDTDTTQTLQQIQNNVDNWDQDEENNEIDNTPRESNNDEETST